LEKAPWDVERTPVPSIVDYEIVLKRLQDDGLRCNYPNGGAFGFPHGVSTYIRGWIGPPDPTIREGMLALVRCAGEPHIDRLATLAIRAWQSVLPGPAWIMPGSHWSFELAHGSKAWLAGLLSQIGVDARSLLERTTAAAIEFLPEEDGALEILLKGLLNGLTSSEFTLAFPERPVITTIHHHKQLWWVSADKVLIDSLDQIELA
jgi:hypothetical protein